MKAIRYILLFLFSLMVAVSVYYTLNQSNYIYFPDSETSSTPEEIGLEYEEVTLQTEDGVRITGWFVPEEENRFIILFCHGNAGNISHRLDFLKMFNRLGLSTFIFDYRGYGESEGSPTEEGTYLDAETAYEYLVRERGIHPLQIIVMGRSLGGPIASYIASRYPVRALIVESSFTSIKDLAPIHMLIPAKFFSKFSYETREYIKNTNVPIIIIHSRDDEIIPFSHGEKLYQAAKGEKKFVEIQGTHSNGYMQSYEKYMEKLNSFINSL